MGFRVRHGFVFALLLACSSESKSQVVAVEKDGGAGASGSGGSAGSAGASGSAGAPTGGTGGASGASGSSGTVGAAGTGVSAGGGGPCILDTANLPCTLG